MVYQKSTIFELLHDLDGDYRSIACNFVIGSELADIEQELLRLMSTERRSDKGMKSTHRIVKINLKVSIIANGSILTGHGDIP